MPYDKDTLGKILIEDGECRTVDENGTLYPPTSPIYTVVAEKMLKAGSHITPRHVYTILNENRNGFKELLLNKYGCKPKPKLSIKEVENTSASFDDENGRSNINLKLILSATNWGEICPRKIISSGRVYWKLKKGWTDIIAERLCQQHPSLECVFSFKNNVVTPCSVAQYYATFTGVCVECESKISGTLLKAPMRDVDVIFNIQVANIQNASHSGDKRRQLRGLRRIKVATQLIKENKGAVAFGREEARRLKKFGGKNVAIIPKAAVLRKAKEQQLLKMHGLEFANPPVNLLYEATYGKYAGSIHSIALLKFHCMYWNPEQQQIYVSRCKGDPNAILTVDATGGIEKRNKHEDPHLFLYQCMLVTAVGSVPVFQMVSCDQRSLMIAFFLRHILAKGAPRPPIVVCDFGRAIVNAVAEIFGCCSDLSEYLQRCYNAVFLKSNALPKTYIRLDVSHLISMVARWECLKGKVVAARRLYLRCVAQAYQIGDVETLSSFIQSIIAVALSEYLGQNKKGIDVPAQKCMNDLNSVIEGVNSISTNISDDICEGNFVLDGSDEEVNEKDQVTDWNSWAANIYQTASEIGNRSKDGNVINACYNPRFAERLKKQLLPFVPLWTGIMRAYFGRGPKIATSSSVEGEFANLKNRVFGGKLPMRIDRFVLEHLQYLEGRAIEASNPQDLPSANPLLKASDQSIPSILPDDDSRAESTHIGDLNTSGSPPNRSKISNTSQTPSCHLNTQDQISNSLLEIADMIAETLSSACSPPKESIPSDTPESVLIWNENEDWRGLVTAKKRRKPTYLDTCPEWQYIKDAKMAKLPILQNGNFCGPVTINSNKINLRNTCAFDSILQLTMGGLANNKSYAESLSKCGNKVIQLAFKLLNDMTKPSQKQYKERATILKSIPLFAFEDQARKGTESRRKLDAECNAAHLTEYLFFDTPSYCKTVFCQCGQKSSRSGVLVHINVDVLLCTGFGSMQQAVDEGVTQMSTCRSCKRINTDVVEYGPHIFIDTSIITDARYTTRNDELRHDLNSLSKSVELGGSKYLLTGVVNWTPGHYVAFVKSGLFWYEYNDIGPVRKSVSDKTQITPHLIMFTITR